MFSPLYPIKTSIFSLYYIASESSFEYYDGAEIRELLTSLTLGAAGISVSRPSGHRNLQKRTEQIIFFVTAVRTRTKITESVCDNFTIAFMAVQRFCFPSTHTLDDRVPKTTVVSSWRQVQCLDSNNNNNNNDNSSGSNSNNNNMPIGHF